MSKLKLNENKTKLMEINMHTNSSFRINNVVIEKVNSTKYLGFIIDRELKQKKHLEYTYIIGHYNRSVRIIDLVSPTTYVVCVNFIHKWRDLQFKVDSERQLF